MILLGRSIMDIIPFSPYYFQHFPPFSFYFIFFRRTFHADVCRWFLCAVTTKPRRDSNNECWKSNPLKVSSQKLNHLSKRTSMPEKLLLNRYERTPFWNEILSKVAQEDSWIILNHTRLSVENYSTICLYIWIHTLLLIFSFFEFSSVYCDYWFFLFL